MERVNISSDGEWEGAVGYSRAVRVGGHIAVAGTTAARQGRSPVGGNDIAEQTREALRRIESALSQAGASLRDVIRTRIFVTDIEQWREVGLAHGEFSATSAPPPRWSKSQHSSIRRCWWKSRPTPSSTELVRPLDLLPIAVLP
ncbi:Enamine/imine deaminase [Mycobacteroides salmoniphilum]|uniref:Enamine/imine deaminase n=1 Tax=Mycobacteroides salmoniphilum TaxID=404941 RepID=A0A4R8SQ13_9MYCO|nr:Enamine/imine deaminase [Mycobacteroides salmoniphilum]